MGQNNNVVEVHNIDDDSSNSENQIDNEIDDDLTIRTFCIRPIMNI